MRREPAASFAIGVTCLVVLLATHPIKGGEVGDLAPKSSARSDDGPQTNNPRATVAKWLELVLADNIPDSWALTTRSKGLNAQHDLPRLSNNNEVRIERALGNESVAVVVTNTVKHPKWGVDRTFAFWLVKRNGLWLINMSYMEDPKSLEEQLRGFFMGGGKWRVINDDLHGTWLAGPGAAGGAGGMSCGSRFQLEDNGKFQLEWWGPGGPGNGIETERGTWRLEEDRIVCERKKQRLISRIAWVGKDSLVLQPADRQWGNGKGGTYYRREKIAREPIHGSNDAPPARDDAEVDTSRTEAKEGQSSG